MERKGLGRGLSSLVGGPLAEEAGGRVLQIPVDEIVPNPQQPRGAWDEEALAELADSIRRDGVLQPLLVRGRPGLYELVAGERRLRAAKLAGLALVPALLRETDEEGSLRLALIENIQREDLSPLDAAQAYQNLIDRFGMTQEDVAKAVGKSRPAVANTLRLLHLPPPISESLQGGRITEGHARALLAVNDQEQQERLWRLAEGGATVRDVETAGRPAPSEATGQPSSVAAVEIPAVTGSEPSSHPPAGSGAQLRTTVRRNPQPLPHLAALADRLRRTLGVKVEIRGDDHQGMLVLEYYSPEDLESLADRLLGEFER